jgi:hypothetical protein
MSKGAAAIIPSSLAQYKRVFDWSVIPWYNLVSVGTEGLYEIISTGGATAAVFESLKPGGKRHPWLGWIVLVLCLLSFARGAYQLGEQSLWWDESLSLHRAVRPFSFILSNRILFLYGTEEVPITPDYHPPLYFVLLRLIVLAAGSSEFSLRYLSLVACVLIVPLLYQCGRRMYDPVTGASAALLAAFSPLYLWAQQEARPYAVATLLGVISFYSLLRVLDLPPDSASTPHLARQRAWAALFILSGAAMLVTHYHTLQLLPAYGAIYVLAGGRRQGRTLWTNYVRWLLLVVGVVAGGVVLYALRNVMPTSDISGYAFVPLGTLLQDLLRSFPLGVSGTRLVFFQWVANGLVLAALAVLLIQPTGSVHRHASARRHAVYLLLCLVLPVGEIYALSFVRPAYMNVRHAMFASPFYYLLLAAGVVQARRLRFRLGRWVSTAVEAVLGVTTVLLLVGMGLSTYTYFTDPRYDKEDHRGWGRYLSEHVRPDDVVFVYPGGVYELYTYYTSSPAPYYGIPAPGGGTERSIRQLVEIGQRYDRVWIAHSLTPGWAYAGDSTIEWAKENAIEVASAEFGGRLNTFPVYAFRLDPPVVDSTPKEASPLALDFGDQLHLLGFRSIAEPVEAGHPLLLSLYWSAAQPLDQEYRFTLSLKDERGRSWSSLDYVPYGGTYPLALWPVGGIVRDDIDIDVPAGTPPGRYWVNVSVYPADRSGPSLAVQEMAAGRPMGLIVPIAEITVTRPANPPSNADIPIARRTKRQYGDLTLLGHDYQGGTYQPGDIVSLDLYWRARRASAHDLAFSLQLADATGGIWASHPIAPAVGYPTSHWQKGELVRAQHRFRVPLDVPEGEYALWLAPGDGNPVSSIWPWSGGRVWLGALSVRPPDIERTWEIPPMQNQLRVLLDDKIELLGYDLQDSTVRPGQVVSCTLYWRALQEMDVSYTVFTHLVAPDGTIWGQWDNQPQQGGAPTTRWIPGQVIVDGYQIPLSPDAQTGSLSLRVGMYDLLTMTRLPMLDMSGALIGDSISIAEIEVLNGTK